MFYLLVMDNNESSGLHSLNCVPGTSGCLIFGTIISLLEAFPNAILDLKAQFLLF